MLPGRHRICIALSGKCRFQGGELQVIRHIGQRDAPVQPVLMHTSGAYLEEAPSAIAPYFRARPANRSRSMRMSRSSTSWRAFPPTLLPQHTESCKCFQGPDVKTHGAAGYARSYRRRQVTYVTFYTEGFGRFVTSTTAPITTGRSERCRVGLPPTGRSRLSTAHVKVGSDARTGVSDRRVRSLASHSFSRSFRSA
jgi:hypothetical protein